MSEPRCPACDAPGRSMKGSRESAKCNSCGWHGRVLHATVGMGGVAKAVKDGVAAIITAIQKSPPPPEAIVPAKETTLAEPEPEKEPEDKPEIKEGYTGKFKIGDKVKALENTSDIPIGEAGTVKEFASSGSMCRVNFSEDRSNTLMFDYEMVLAKDYVEPDPVPFEKPKPIKKRKAKRNERIQE